MDASVAVKWVTNEPLADEAVALQAQWAREGAQMIAPAFFFVEVDSILRRKAAVIRATARVAELSREGAGTAFRALLLSPMVPVALPGQRERAWEIAQVFGFPTVYDATYTALAEIRGCEFWTADDRRADRVGDGFPLLRRLSDFTP